MQTSESRSGCIASLDLTVQIKVFTFDAESLSLLYICPTGPASVHARTHVHLLRPSGSVCTEKEGRTRTSDNSPTVTGMQELTCCLPAGSKDLKRAGFQSSLLATSNGGKDQDDLTMQLKDYSACSRASYSSSAERVSM